MGNGTDLAEGLSCPKCNSAVEMTADKTEVKCVNAKCGLIYPIRDGVPVMNVADARVDN